MDEKTTVQMSDGSKMETSLPAEKVSDLQAKPETSTEPAKPAVDAAKPEAQPASQTDDEQPPKAKAEEPKPAEPAPQEQQPKDEQGRFKPKPKPIAKLLEERHTLREENAKLKADLEKAGKQQVPVSDADITKIMEKYKVDEANRQFITELVQAIQAGTKTELPKELQELAAEHQQNKLLEAEEEGFNTDYNNLIAGLGDEKLNDPKVKERVMELAYSEDNAPDGKPFHSKSLLEIYNKFVKPELEPGKPSAEASRGGSKAGGKVIDFKEIVSDPAKMTEFAKTATDEQFAKFHKWQLENEKEPLRKPGF